MTCIVGLEQNGRAWLGADAFVGSNSYADLDRRPKVYRVGCMVVGHSGSVRRDNVLRSFMATVKARKIWDDRAVVRHVIEPMRRVLDDHGVRHRSDSNGNDDSGNTLIAVGGRLFEISGDFGVIRSRFGYAAIGSGACCALGSLCSTGATGDHPPKLRVRMALEAAERHTPSVRRPWTILEAA